MPRRYIIGEKNRSDICNNINNSVDSGVVTTVTTGAKDFSEKELQVTFLFLSGPLKNKKNTLLWMSFHFSVEIAWHFNGIVAKII